MSLNIDKYKGISLEKNYLDHIYTMWSQEQIFITQESDVGNIIDTINSVNSCSGKKKKKILRISRKGMENRTEDITLPYIKPCCALI